MIENWLNVIQHAGNNVFNIIQNQQIMSLNCETLAVEKPSIAECKKNFKRQVLREQNDQGR